MEHCAAKTIVITRSNPKLLPDEEYETKALYPGIHHSTSNMRTIRHWLRDEEKVSVLKEHVPVMKLMQAIAFSLERQGESVVADFI